MGSSMLNDRFINEQDLPLLEASLENDQYHTTTNSDFFTKEGTLTKVYELDEKPVLFCRACKCLRLDIQFVNNGDIQANRTVMLEGFPLLVEQAKKNGFAEVVFNTTNPLLKRFCIKKLGFEAIEGDELRRIL